MIIPQLLWFLLLVACLAWYGLLTVYVSWHGGRDILRMLDRLSREPESSPPAAADRRPVDSSS